LKRHQKAIFRDIPEAIIQGDTEEESKSVAADAWWGCTQCAARVARAAHPMTKPMAEDAGAA
jgi:hypothetical protein